MKKVYYEGKLIPVKDWDFEKKRPKEKVSKKETVKEESMPRILVADNTEDPAVEVEADNLES
jgi:hypothetical protein